MTTTTRKPTTTAAKFGPLYVPQGTQIHVRKAGTTGAWKEHRTISGVLVPAAARWTTEAMFCHGPNGETNHKQFTAMGFEVIVDEAHITYDCLTEETVTGPGECPKCMGRGVITAFRHVANGVCFWCKGKGTC